MLKILSVLFITALLSGCAAMNRLSSEVASYGPWPADRQAAAFAFERLPSQRQQPEAQQRLEDAASPALEAAGFRQVADPAVADYSVQLGARVTGDDRWYPDDGFGGLFGMRGFYRHPRFGHGLGLGRFPHGPSVGPQYLREVVLLIRDRRSGQTVYETRASNQGGSAEINSLLPAMFEAALKDFPNGGINPRQVVTEIRR